VSCAQMRTVIKALEDVAEGVRSEYTKGPDGRFYLKLEGLEEHPDVAGLRTAKQHEKDDRIAAETRAKELQKRLDDVEAEFREKLKGTVGKDEVERLEKLYKQQVDDLTAASGKGAEALKMRDNAIRKLTVDNAALTLAGDIAKDETVIPLFLPHLTRRLGVEYTKDGEAVTRVLDDAGKVTDKTVAQLREEFVANPAFSSIVKGSKATGGGATGGNGVGGATPATGDKATMSAKDLAAAIAAKKKART
jgi:hypothetical protein